tara:strand:+ start:3008 stop:4030 length:1023 start_codon:yes stop_codon:yes gene_type:complete
MAPVILALKENDHKVIVGCTGQHDVTSILKMFGLQADIIFECQCRDRGFFLGEAAGNIIGHGKTWKYGTIIAQGDTDTAAAASMAAFDLRVPFTHIEAGLRTGDMDEPRPEERNRRICAINASIHCAPTETAKENLDLENLAGKVYVTGNPIVDALEFMADRVSAIPREHPGCVLITMHRRENWDKIESVARAISEMSSRYDETFVWVLHPNPEVTRLALDGFVTVGDNFIIHSPMEYPQFLKLLHSCRLVVSDSGGVQEECCYYKKQLLIMRDKTERPEAIDYGVAKLVGTDADHVCEEIEMALDPPAPDYKLLGPCPFGDGNAATKIVRAIEDYISRE